MKLRRLKRGQPGLPIYTMPSKEIFNEAFIRRMGKNLFPSNYLNKYVNCEELYDEVDKALSSKSKQAISWGRTTLIHFRVFTA